MAGDARTEGGGERVSASEVRVDLREALSGAGETNGAPRQTEPRQTEARETPPPARQTPPPPREAQTSGGDRSQEAPPAGVEPDPLTAELFPADVYRIVDGREVKDNAWTRLVSRTKELLTSPPAKQEQHLDRELRQLRVRGLAHGVTVAFGSIKGGVGKTTLTLSIADTLADALRCGVLVVDADLEWGTAADSTPQDGGRAGTLSDVLANRERISSPGDLAPYLMSLPGGAQLLAGPTDPAQIEELDSADMQELLELLRHFFPVILLDLSPGIGLRGTIPRWAFGAADEIVAIATPTRGSLRRAGRMLSYLSQHRADVPITLALNMVPQRPDEATRRVIEVAERNGSTRRYVAIPRDEALMRQLDTGLLDLGYLDQHTRIAIKNLAHQLASTWCR